MRLIKVLAVSFMVASASYAQQTADVAASLEASKPSDGLLEGSSVQIYNHVKANDTKKKSRGQTTWIIEPHFTMPILGKFAELDVYGGFTRGEKGERAHFNKPEVTAEVRKVVIDNNYFYIDPYINFNDVFSGTNISIEPYFSGIAKYPISMGMGVVEPYLFNESSITFYTANKETKVKYFDPAGNQGRLLTADEAKIANLTGEETITVDKSPITTYTRLATAIKPNAVPGLTVTVASNFIYNRNSTPIVNVDLTKPDQKAVSNYDSEWSLTAQPMLRLEYKVNDKLHLRNSTTVDMDKMYERPTAGQKKAGDFSNTTRLIYTIY